MGPNSLVIIQWNIQSMKAKRHYLHHLIHIFKSRIILLQETWTNKNYSPSLTNYFWQFQHRDDDYRSITIGIRSGLPFQRMYLSPILNGPNFNTLGIDIAGLSVPNTYTPTSAKLSGLF